jgi:hypothetical protein
MRSQCPYCLSLVKQKRNLEGPNFCPACQRLFVAPRPKEVPQWVLGLLALLMANLQMLKFH